MFQLSITSSLLAETKAEFSAEAKAGVVDEQVDWNITEIAQMRTALGDYPHPSRLEAQGQTARDTD